MRTAFYCLFISLFSVSACQSQVSHRCAFPYSAHTANDLCGYMEVPEDRAHPEGKKISIAYLVIKSKSKKPKSDPVIFLQGGPGGFVLPLANTYSSLSLDSDRDFILYDARGTGYSNALCPSLGAKLMDILALDISSDQEYQALEEHLNSCQEELASNKVNVEAYSTLENAMDLEDLRKHLGYDQWNIYGGSYGTRLGLVYMDLFPKSVRSAILIGVFPPQIRMYDALITNFNQSLHRLFKNCQQDPNCSKQYPDLEQVFLQTFQKLTDHPLVFEWNEKTFTLNSQDMLLFIHQQLYARNTIASVPALILAIKERNEGYLSSAVDQLSQRLLTINHATYWSVMACDEGGYDNQKKLQHDLAKNAQYHLGLGLFSTDPKVYENWLSDKSCFKELEVVLSDIPTLLVSGGFDPVTPPSNAQEAARTLKNSYLVQFENEGHAPFNPCFFRIAAAFLDDPEQGPDISCSKQVRAIRFK